MNESIHEIHEMETQFLGEIDIPNTQKTNEIEKPQRSIHEMETQYLDDPDEIPATQKTDLKINIHQLNTQLIEEKITKNIHELDTQLVVEKVERNINEMDTQIIEESTENSNRLLETQEVEEEPENLLTNIHEIETQFEVNPADVSNIIIPETQFETSGVKNLSLNNYSNLIIDSSLDISDSQILQACENKSGGEPVDSICELDETQYDEFVAEPNIPINNKLVDHNFDGNTEAFDAGLDDSDFINVSTDISQESKMKVTGTNNNTIKTANEKTCETSVINTTNKKESFLKNISDASTTTHLMGNQPSELILSCQQTPATSNSLLKTPIVKPVESNPVFKSPVGGSKPGPNHFDDITPIKPVKNDEDEDIFDQPTQISAINVYVSIFISD